MLRRAYVTEVGGRDRPKVIGLTVSKCPKMMGKQ